MPRDGGRYLTILNFEIHGRVRTSLSWCYANEVSRWGREMDASRYLAILQHPALGPVGYVAHTPRRGIRVDGLDEARRHRILDDARPLRLVASEAERRAHVGVGDRGEVDVGEAGLHVAGADTVLLGGELEGHAGEESRLGEVPLLCLDNRRDELVFAGGLHDLVVAAATLLTDAALAHEARHDLVVRYGHRVHDALHLDEWRASVGGLNAVVEHLDHGVGATLRKVLMDETAGEKLAHSHLREGALLTADAVRRLLALVCDRHDLSHHLLESDGIAVGELPLALGVAGPGCAPVAYDPD